MKIQIHPQPLRSMMLAATFGISIAAQAADDTPTWTYGGHLDFYYLYDFGKPPTALGTNGRQFDVKNNQFSLAVLEVDVSRKPTASNPFGITANFTFGKNADIISFLEPGGPNSTKQIQQLFVTYALPKSEMTLDFGKYLTNMGYEGVDSSANDNYSRSFLYTLGQMIYHTGFRLNAPLTKTLTGNLYLVNGWNEVEDSNGGKSYGASLAFNPSAKTSVMANYYGGQEGSAGVNGIGLAGARGINFGDLVISHQLTEKVKLAINADYTDAKGFDGTTGGHWSGIAGYVKAQLTDKFSGAVRYEAFSDPDGLRSGFQARYNSLTGTLDYAMSKDSLLRFEVRYDKSNLPVYNSDKAGGLSDNRTTLSLSHVLKF